MEVSIEPVKPEEHAVISHRDGVKPEPTNLVNSAGFSGSNRSARLMSVYSLSCQVSAFLGTLRVNPRLKPGGFDRNLVKC